MIPRLETHYLEVVDIRMFVCDFDGLYQGEVASNISPISDLCLCLL